MNGMLFFAVGAHLWILAGFLIAAVEDEYPWPFMAAASVTAVLSLAAAIDERKRS